MKNEPRQSGYSLPWILISMGICFALGYGFSLLAPYIPTEKPLMPLALMGPLLAPITTVAQLIFKLNDTKKLKGTNRDEKRRLDHIVSVKRFRLYLLETYYVAATIAIGSLFYAASLPLPVNIIPSTLFFTGFVLSTAGFTCIYTIIESRRITDFEAKLNTRIVERKNKAALLKRLESKADSKS